MTRSSPLYQDCRAANTAIVASLIGSQMAAQLVAQRQFERLIISPFLLLIALGIRLLSERLTNSEKWSRAVTIVALLLLVVAASAEHYLPSYPGLWAGFGLLPTSWALAIALTMTVQPYKFREPSQPKTWKSVLVALVLVVVVFDRLLLLIQPPDGLTNLGDSTYIVLDELLAPLTGSIPYSDFTPSYTGLLGWVLLPLRFLSIGIDLKMTSVIAIANIFTIAIPLLVVAISRLLLPKSSRLLTFCAFVSLWTVCGPDLGYSAQVREFSQFARYLPSLFGLWLVLRCVSLHQTRLSRQRTYIAGFFLGASVLNSADTGLTLGIAIAIALVLLACKAQKYLWTLSRLLLGAAGFFITYVAALRALGRDFDLTSYFGIRGSALAGDVYPANESISRGFGPHSLVFAIPVVLLVFYLFPDREDSHNVRRNTERFLGLTVAFWLLAQLLKFLSQPHAVAVPAQFIPLFLGGVVIASAIRLQFNELRGTGKRLILLPCVFILALPAAGVLPDSKVSAQDEIKRISGRYVNTNDWSTTPTRPVDGWSRRALTKEDNFLNEVEQRARKFSETELRIGYFGMFGNTVELVTGVDNLLGIPTPEGFGFQIDYFQLACKSVDEKKVDLIIVYQSRFPCSGYHVDFSESTPRFLVFRRNQ